MTDTIYVLQCFEDTLKCWINVTYTRSRTEAQEWKQRDSSQRRFSCINEYVPDA